MTEWNEPAGTGLSRRILIFVGAFALLCIVIYFTSPAPPPRPEDKSVRNPESLVTGRDCERRLEQALAGLHPQRIVIGSSRIDRVAELTQWAIECADAESLSRLAYSGAPNERWLTGDFLARTRSAQYSVRDAQHIALCRLCGQLAEHVSKKTIDPREQSVLLFDEIVRETELDSEASVQEHPRTVLEALMIGRATPSERAWGMAVLCRQLRRDVVIIEPETRPDQWLIGVLKPEGDVWLFEPRLGTAIPSASEIAPGLVALHPATLSEVRADDSLLRRMDLEGAPYPLKSDDLKVVKVRLIGESSTFSERMARVQALIRGYVMEVFDGLGESALRAPGLVERVTGAGKNGLWAEDAISVWTYPDQQMDAYLSRGAESEPYWKPTTEIFGGPIVLSTVRQGENQSRWIVGRISNPLREVRMMQLAGDDLRALQLYLPIREQAYLTNGLPDEPQLLSELQAAAPANLAAADYAIYWTALAQVDVGRGALAASTLQQYQRNFPLGVMRNSAPELFVRALVAEGATEPAVQWIGQIPARARTPRLNWLLKLLQGEMPPANPAASDVSPAAPPSADGPPPTAGEAAAASDDAPPSEPPPPPLATPDP